MRRPLTLALDVPVLGPEVQAPEVLGPNVFDAQVADADVGIGWPPARPA